MKKINKITIIAEAGVNHNGRLDLALKLIEAAKDCGADAIKFQIYKTKNIIIKNASKANYQKKTTDIDVSQYEMLKKLELSDAQHLKIKKHCEIKKINYLSSVFDIESLNFLTKKLKLDTVKIPSGDITNGPLLLECAKQTRNIILSTGLSNSEDIKKALSIFAFGFLSKNKKPNTKNFLNYYNSSEGKKVIKERVTLLHCTSEYPAPSKDLNLNAIKTISKIFGTNVGYSDHSKGIIAPIIASALGAKIIEKHFTLNKNFDGPDHKSSLEPSMFKKMVNSIRDVEEILGTGLKVPKKSEIKNKSIVRKSLVAVKQINKDQIFTKNNIGIKRPGTGSSPLKYWELIGKKSKKLYLFDEFIDE